MSFPPGVIKLVKVYVSMKRKIQVGDKMAGRMEIKAWSLGLARGRHAVLAGWDAGRNCAESARCAITV